MHRSGRAYRVREAAANPDAPLRDAMVVLVYSAVDVTWRRDVADHVRAAGAMVRVASGAAERRKALADGRVTQLIVDEDTASGEGRAAHEGSSWPEHLPMLRRLPGEAGAHTVARLLEGLAPQGTMRT